MICPTCGANSLKKRSLPQNKLLHVYIGIMAKELGYDRDDMKEIIKYKFLLSERVDENTGEVFKYVKDTSKLSKEECTDLIESLIRWASEQFAVVLYSPGEQTRFD